MGTTKNITNIPPNLGKNHRGIKIIDPKHAMPVGWVMLGLGKICYPMGSDQLTVPEVLVSCNLNDLHPGRLTWNLKITYLKRKIIFQTSIIMFHVNLPGCMRFVSVMMKDTGPLKNHPVTFGEDEGSL